MDSSELLAGATLEQIKQGYAETEDSFTCLCCGEQTEKGIIYPVGGRLCDAQRAMRLHIEQKHGSVFAHLIRLDKSVTGLTDVQRRLLALFYQGKSDAEIQEELGAGSTSTIRNHRFILREKERQAKLFLALMELLRERQGAPGRGAGPAGGSAGDRLLKKYFPFGTEGPLLHFSASIPEKHKRLIAARVAEQFQPGRRYTEPEVNQLLERLTEDYALLRRCLVDYGHLNRLPDGSQYWRTTEDKEEGRTMDRRKELKQLARETKIEAGVYQIRNLKNGKVLIESTPNLRTINGRRFQLEMGSHLNRQLQSEWDQFGSDSFAFEVLEVLKEPEEGYFDKADALEKLKQKWLEQLRPCGERGYHSEAEVQGEPGEQ